MIIKKVLFEGEAHGKLLHFLEGHPKTQVIGANLAFGEKHVLHCVHQVLKAFAQRRNLSKSEELEFLLAISGERQIKSAISKARAGREAVFVSWSEGCEKAYADFVSGFNAKEIPMGEFQDAEVMGAMERGATFWV